MRKVGRSGGDGGGGAGGKGSREKRWRDITPVGSWKRRSRVGGQSLRSTG